MKTHCLAFAVVCVLIVTPPSLAPADQSLDLIAGFDADRLEQVARELAEDQPSEAAKLIYRLRKIRSSTLAERAVAVHANQQTDQAIDAAGAMIRIQGVLRSRRTLSVAKTLSESLNLTSVELVQIELEQQDAVATASLADDSVAKAVWTVAVSGVSPQVSVGDRVAVDGVRLSDHSRTLAAAKLRWFPTAAKSPSWQWLADHGMDISLLPPLAQRDRMALGADDSEAFYGLLSIASVAASKSEPPGAVNVGAIDLLKDSGAFVGQFVSVVVETVQITRVEVGQHARQQQLGSDHYFQIDAIGKLDDVVIKIETEPGMPPAKFENRYPLSIVTRDLPDFLKDKMDADGTTAIASNLRMQIEVEGFFFRLWSYSSQYMRRFGDAKQFGPLVMASRMTSRQPQSADPVGVQAIGWIAAGGIVAAIAGALLWNWQNARSDRRLQSRKENLRPPTIDVPDP